MTNMELLSTAVVVAAEQHNPTILHFSFLKSEGIVPGDWEPREESSISTPAVSMIEFSNRVSFHVESDKLVITHNGPAGPRDSLIAGLAAGYVRTLPHVRYKAVGINAASFVECAAPDEALIQRFLQLGTWSENGPEPVSLSLQMTYATSLGKLQVSLKPVKLQVVGDTLQRQGILVETNCHADTPTVEATLAAINHYPEKLQQSLSVVAKLIDAEMKG